MVEIPEIELQEMSERAGMVNETIRTRGWTEVIRPALAGKREGLIKTMLSKKFENIIDLNYVQQSINAIDAIFVLVESTLAEGEEADKILKEAALKGQNEH